MVADHARPDFRMGTYHRDLATLLVDASEKADITNQQMIKVSCFNNLSDSLLPLSPLVIIS